MRPLCSLRRGAFLWLLSLVLAWPSASPAQDLQGPGFAYYEVGDLEAPRSGPRVPAMMLMGGGEWVPEAFQWWLKQAGHGRVLILRASGKDELQDRLYHQIGGTTAVQTLVFDSRRGADDPAVLRVVAAADAIFIAGGDQSRYIRFWKGTALNRALNAHVRAGKPIAGTSAGLAILGGYAYGAMDGGSITSAGALADPMGRAVTLDSGFLQMPYLQRVVTDTHFDKRDRLGRLIVFVARAALESGDPGIVGIGIGVDEDTALCVEPDGQAQVYSADGQGRVWVVSPGRGADRLVEGEPLRFHAVPVTVVASGSRMRLDDVQAEADYQAVADISDGEIEFTLR
ncbi:cyanophycinase [Stenotrophomonas maltophilia]|uniref:Peptidase n=1 Tax=Stenotrophomonas maltophilia TaxID=40324 RepID=A0AB34TN69_STEMA|nr:MULTISPECIES: cyanophycinase [Stenotrophomonas]KOO84689.1 peptidase [Stenotrophomonas maltophilia]MBH1542610.1 cyanophycinase [Stenotrophomonas maltophilia]MBN4983725.1 cyanophycinase [Stenotrophomonas maltophilia]MDZ7475963.1 cyanophycinase [Stenotrophomonas pavanii]